jgi:hypothetical protein
MVQFQDITRPVKTSFKDCLEEFWFCGYCLYLVHVVPRGTNCQIIGTKNFKLAKLFNLRKVEVRVALNLNIEKALNKKFEIC